MLAQDPGTGNFKHFMERIEFLDGGAAS